MTAGCPANRPDLQLLAIVNAGSRSIGQASGRRKVEGGQAAFSSEPSRRSSSGPLSGPSCVWAMLPLRSTTTVNGSAERSFPKRLRQLDGAIAADQRRVIQSDLLRELLHLVGLIDGDAYKLDAFSAIPCLDRDELGHLLAARDTPCRPEIDDEHLAPPLRERLLVSLRVRENQREDCGAVAGPFVGLLELPRRRRRPRSDGHGDRSRDQRAALHPGVHRFT